MHTPGAGGHRGGMERRQHLRAEPRRPLATLSLAAVALVLVAVAAWLALPSWGDDHDTGLEPSLAAALEEARVDASAEGVDLSVTSGLRTVEQQQALWDDALIQHGSARESRRWVLPPEESAHVSGTAIDVAGPAADWLQERGADYGLCRRYANEWWHFELLTEPGGTCPPLVADAGG